VDKSSAGIANEATNAASTKNAQNEQMTEIERKNKIREVLKKLIPQMKTGCKKTDLLQQELQKQYFDYIHVCK